MKEITPQSTSLALERVPSLKNTYEFSPETLRDIAKIESIIGKIEVGLLYSFLSRIIRIDVTLTQVDKIDNKDILSYLLTGIENHTINSDFITHFKHYKKLLKLGLTRQRLYEIKEEVRNYNEQESSKVFIDLAINLGIHDQKGREYLFSLIDNGEITPAELVIIKSMSSIDLSDFQMAQL